MADMEFTVEQLEGEEWRPIPGFEGIYSASTLGRIRHEQGSYRPRTRLMKPVTASYGYRRVRLFRDHASRVMLIHRVIMLTFVGPRPTGMHIDHVNGVRHDNRFANLEYVTPAENNRRAVARAYEEGREWGGARPPIAPRLTEHERHPGGKFSPAIISEVRRSAAAGERQCDIAARLGMSFQHVSSVVRCTRWASVP